MQQQSSTDYDCLISCGYEFIQTAPREDGLFEVVMTKNGRTITLLTDEPFISTKVDHEHNKTDNSIFKQALAVAIIQQYEQTPNDIDSAFSLDELTQVVNIARPLIDMDVRVEQLYKQAWDNIQVSATGG